VNHVELRLFLKDKLGKFNILAFDLVKNQGKKWAVLTIANPDNGRRFLELYGSRGRLPLLFGSTTLNCKISNKEGQPEPLKVIALLQKEEQYRARRGLKPSVEQAPGSAQPIFTFQNLMTGVWGYDRQGKLFFERKFTDLRVGSITFGKSALVIYLEQTQRQDYNWHGRIDIPYAILEHAIPSIEQGKRGSITLTLKSPPKFYEILGTDDLHLYTGRQAAANPSGLPDLAALNLGTLGRHRRPVKLARLCSLHPRHDRSSTLCMVYKLLFPSLHLVYQAWYYIKDFTVPEAHCWNTMESRDPMQDIEKEYKDIESALSQSSLEFAVKFQVQALALEGTITPSKMLELVPCISAMSGIHGTGLTALAVRNLGGQLPTPGPHVESTNFQAVVIRKLLHDNVLNAKKAEATYDMLHGRRKQHEHLALTYKATVTPTGTCAFPFTKHSKDLLDKIEPLLIVPPW
jgi:hypothetical protein